MGLISSIIGLATGILNFMGIKEAMKYVDQLDQLQKDLLTEKGKDYAHRDDTRIENLEHELVVALQAVQSQFALFAASKGAPAPTPPVA